NIYKLLFYFLKKGSCKSGTIFDLFICLKKKFTSLVEWFERLDVQYFYSLAA
ncbi:unnamed protein product, partial [Bubo scandiacus]